MRFYAGTPLVTKLGAPIGSVFVIDDRPRKPPTPAEIDFLGIMARNVMEYLEMNRGSELLQRNDVMSRGLAALVEGHSFIPPERSDNEQQGANGNEDIVEMPKKKMSPPNKSIKGILETLKHEDSSGSEEQSSRAPLSLPLNTGDGDMTHDRIFARASNLLRESLAADYAVFFDPNVALPSAKITAPGNTVVTPTQYATTQSDKTQDPTASSSAPDEAGSTAGLEAASPTSDTVQQDSNSTVELAHVLSFATKRACSLNGDKMTDDHGFNAPDLRRLGRLLRKYPVGKLVSTDSVTPAQAIHPPLVNSPSSIGD